MKKYDSCSKILEDIPILNGVRMVFRGKGVPGLRCSSRWTDPSFGGNLVIWNLPRQEVYLADDFYKKTLKKFKILSLHPLILLTKGAAMINNMVLSREIEWIGYEHKRNMLQVEFIMGSIYQYENVPETVYQEFLTASSHGCFFESNIKNKYRVRKIR